MLPKNRLLSAVKAASVHLICSLCLAALAAMLVFFIWYPYPYQKLSGGTELFLLIVGVDVVCGPLLTLVLFNPKKSAIKLVTDLSLVTLIQLIALGYGLYTMAMARPVYLVFEVDRFKVVSCVDIPKEQLRPELGGFHKLPWGGPKIIGIREPKNTNEKFESLDLSLQGQEPSARPDWWQVYDLSKDKVIARSKPLTDLRSKRPLAASLINRAVEDSGKIESELRWLPLTSFKSSEWVAFIDAKTAFILAYAPIDGF
jgi:hypothetical protein